ARALLAAAEVPIAAPSANRFQGISPTTAAHVARSLGDEDLLILDGGPTSVGIESTVLDLCGPRPLLLRPGGLPLPALEAVLGPLERAEAIADGVARASPGMVDRHYAPGGTVHLLPMVALAELATEVPLPAPVGALLIHGAVPGRVEHVLHMPDDPGEYGRTLYAALHTLDELGCATILIEAVPDEPAWEAIADRLSRAAR
ncbi:MAG: Sua5/YciO/YrdC/YwlC family protein, partial [Myxococcales bacterium]|nr:Sua5/YciO/YrdC/YwlC family protein [Myxococcales bacterium]